MGRGRGWLSPASAALVALSAACTYGVPDVATIDASPRADGPLVDSTAFRWDGGPTDASLTDSIGRPETAVDSAPGDGASGPDGSTGPCNALQWKATTTVAASSTTFAVPAPVSLTQGDYLLAYLAWYLSVTATVTLTPPPGWVAVGPSVKEPGQFGGNSFLSVYGRMAGAVEPASYVWTASRKVEAVAWILDYTGVSPTDAFEQASARGVNVGATFSTPSAATSLPGELLIATFASTTYPPADAWQLPPGTTQRALATDGLVLGGVSDDRLSVSAGDAGVFVSVPESDAGLPQLGAIITHIVALRPCP